MTSSDSVFKIHDEVGDALASGQPVVAMESTIFSHLGLPSPANADGLERCIEAIRSRGAVPALTVVLDGVAHVGLDPALHERVLGPARKVAARDLGVAIAQRWEVGATTVSASLALAARAGISVFTTGGIGGVHRDVSTSGDVSADLDALHSFPLVTVCAGAKAFLDLPRTLEHLEMVGVPVLGWRSDELPAFTATTSGLPVPHRVESAEEVAAAFVAARALHQDHGLVVTVPLGAEHALPSELLDSATDDALAEAEREGLSGAAVTPFVLERIAEVTAGASVPANLALAEQNAEVAADIAGAISRLRREHTLG